MSAAILSSALLVALAVWLVLPGPALARVADRPRRRLPMWLQPRPDALPASWRLGLAGLAVLAVSLVVPAPVGWLGAAVGLPVGFWALGRMETGTTRARRRAVVRDLPETLELLAAALEAGAPLRLAVAEVGRAGPSSCAETLRSVQARVGVGISDADAWASLRHDENWGAVARDLSRSAETGAAAARLLRLHAEEARQRRRDEQLKRARAVGVRSTVPLMTCFLPAFLLVGVVPIVAGLVGGMFGR